MPFLGICDASCKCKKRCRSEFAHIEVQEACVNRCKGSNDFKRRFGRGEIPREEFLCQMYPTEEYMLMTGIDPCPNDGISLPELLDPADTSARRKEKLQDYLPILGGGALVILLLVFFLVRK